MFHNGQEVGGSCVFIIQERMDDMHRCTDACLYFFSSFVVYVFFEQECLPAAWMYLACLPSPLQVSLLDYLIGWWMLFAISSTLSHTKDRGWMLYIEVKGLLPIPLEGKGCPRVRHSNPQLTKVRHAPWPGLLGTFLESQVLSAITEHGCSWDHDLSSPWASTWMRTKEMQIE